MVFRLWIGLWTALFLLLLVLFNLSFLVKYITRFTEDSFATLVAVIFIIDAVKSTIGLRHSDVVAKKNNATLFNQTSKRDGFNFDLKDANQETYFYFSVLLFLLTFFVSSTLKGFRNKPYLPSKVNFGKN